MQRVLHVAFFLRVPIGVQRQMEWEQQAADELGIAWHSRIFSPFAPASKICVSEACSVASVTSGFLGRAWQWISLRRDFADWVLKESRNYEIVLVRYSVANPFLLRLVKRLRSHGKSIYLVHHTKEHDEIIMKGGMAALAKANLENFLARRTLRAATGLVAVTNEIAAYEKRRTAISSSVHCYPNGIRVDSVPVPDDRRDPPELLFVATDFVKWHGFDLLIDEFERTKMPCVLHVVGRVRKEDESRAARDPRILLHGQLSSIEIGELAAKCSVGLSSFALHRKGMDEACTLKVREYLGFGLPVYSGHADCFPVEFPYYRKGEALLEEILAYAHQCSGISRSEVRLSAIPFIDKSLLLDRLHTSIIGESGRAQSSQTDG